MGPEIPLALICLTCLGLSDFLYRFGQRYGLKPGPFMLTQNIPYLITAVTLASLKGELIFSPWLVLGLGSGVLAFAAFLCILLALREGEATALVPIVRLNFAVTGVLTVIFIGEPLTQSRVVALTLAAAAILLVGSGIGRVTDNLKPLAYALGAMLCFGIIGLLYKFGLRGGATAGAMVVCQSLGVLCMAVPFAVYRKERFAFSGGRFWIPVVCGVLTAASYVALATAFTFGDAVVVAPIAQLSFVLTSILAVVLLGEKLTWRKSTGMAMAVLAVTIFAFG